MDVTVDLKCGRCSKKTPTTMSVEEANKLQEKDQREKDAAISLHSVINESLTEDSPDVVVAVRGENGIYTVKHLSNLCVAPGATRNKGCAPRVEALLADLTKAAEPKPRKPRTPAEKPLEKPVEPVVEEKQPETPKPVQQTAKKIKNPNKKEGPKP